MEKSIQLTLAFASWPEPKKVAPVGTRRPTGPCQACELYEVCDKDYCGRNEGTAWSFNTRFSNLGEFIQFKKDWGWLK